MLFFVAPSSLLFVQRDDNGTVKFTMGSIMLPSNYTIHKIYARRQSGTVGGKFTMSYEMFSSNSYNDSKLGHLDLFHPSLYLLSSFRCDTINY